VVADYDNHGGSGNQYAQIKFEPHDDDEDEDDDDDDEGDNGDEHGASYDDDRITDDAHHAHLVEMLVGAKEGFDLMITACIEEFSAKVAELKIEVKGGEQQINSDISILVIEGVE
jgi:ABC-type Zn2+ transport system substrate-binding protein/surface adhesin